LDFRDDLRAFFFAAPGDDDPGAGAGEFEGGGFSDARGSSRHEGGFA